MPLRKSNQTKNLDSKKKISALKAGKNELFDLTGYNIIPEASRSSYFYITEIVANYCWQKHKLFPINTLTIVHFKQNKWQVYYAVKNPNHFGLVLRRFVKNPTLLKKAEDFMTQTRDKTTKRIASRPMNSLTNNELGNLLSYFYLQTQEMHKAAMTLRLIDRGAIDYFNRFFSANGLNNYSNILSASSRRSFTTQENIAILKLASRVDDGSIKLATPSYNLELEKIYNNFCWLTLGYYNEPLPGKHEYDKRIKALSRRQPLKILKETTDNFAKEVKERSALLKKMPLEVRNVSQIAAESSYIKDYFKFSTNKIQLYGERIFEEISRRSGLAISELKNLSHNDAIRVAREEKINQNEIKNYHRHTVFISLTGKIREKYTGSLADKYEKQFLTRSKNTSGEFKGRTACPGKISGYAQVVYSPKDFPKVNKGDIIVVMNTSPDFVPLLARVGAVVAEEGGITAHVSVISRELKIPCVVGISHVTKEIKDGDYLEVNAGEGTVKIITPRK